MRRGQKFSSPKSKRRRSPQTRDMKVKEGGMKIKSAGPDSGERVRARGWEREVCAVEEGGDLRCDCDFKGLCIRLT